MKPETRNPKPETAAKRSDRSEDTYIIDAGMKLMKVFEVLEGRAFEPVSIRRVAQRTGFSEDYCRRALITLKKSGWAKQILGGRATNFVLGSKAENLARRLSAHALSASG